MKYLSVFLTLCLATGFVHAEECPAPKSDLGYTKSENVNLRSAPSTSAKILRSLAIGTQFEVVGKNDVCSTIDGITARWISVRTLDEGQALDGWVFDQHIIYQVDSPEIIAAFDVYNDYLPSALGPVWVGLAKTVSGYELKQYSLKIKKSSKQAVDHSSMYHITTVPAGDLVFLVKGVPNIKPGNVVAAKPVSRSISITEKNQFALSLGAERYRFSTGCVARDRMADEQKNGANKYYSCDLEIKGPANSAFAIKNPSGEARDLSGPSNWQPYGWISKLVWAGDLDGDGKLDFLLEEESFGTSANTLYLSSMASPKKIAIEAATVSYTWD